MAPAAILEDQKSLLIAFLDISDQYQIYFLDFVLQNTPSGHFGWPKITFDRISNHFRSILNFYFFKFVYKMATGVHFGWLKITSIAFLNISDQYQGYLFLIFFLQTNIPRWRFLDDRKSLSITFLAIWDQCATFILFLFFSQNGCRGPFWMIENHFWSHFSPFQINTQLLFAIIFSKWLPAAILEVRFGPFWMTENQFRSDFSPFQINMQQNGRRRPFWKSDMRQKQQGSSTMCYQWLCHIWSWSVNL